MIVDVVRDLINLTGKHLFRLWFVSIVLSLLPVSIFERFGILQYWKQYETVVTATAFVLTLLVIASLLFEAGVLTVKVIGSGREQRNRRDREAAENRAKVEQAIQLKIARLKILTPKHQAYLKTFVDQNTRTSSFRISDGVAADLESMGILRRASTLSTVYDYFDYNIDPEVFQYLRAHPELLVNADEVILDED